MLGLPSLRVYKPPKKRKGPKGKKNLERPRAAFFATTSVEIVADPNPVDSNASFRAEVANAPSRVQPVRAAKLRRVPIVEVLDSDVTGQASSSSSSSSRGSSSDSDSVSDCDSGSHSLGSAGSGDSSVATSSAVDVSSDCSTSTSSSETETAPAAPPPKKKFRHTAVRVGNIATQLPTTIDVDAESNSAPQQHLLSEADFFPTDSELAVTKDTG